jgi:surfeit locus 1 family protein
VGLQYIVKWLEFESMRVQVRIVPLTLLMVLAIVFVSLGNWQLERKSEKQDLINGFEQAREMNLEQALSSKLDFARTRIFGHYESQWQLLLDNKIWQGRPGVHVLNLFISREGIPVLVDRGWLAMNPDRRSLPEVTTPVGEVVISGLLSRPPGDGVQLGEPDAIEQLQGPVLVTYLNIDTIAQLSGQPIAPMILKLDAQDESGFENRDWQPAVILPSQHQAYAVQWFALAIAAIILIFTIAVRLRRAHS